MKQHGIWLRQLDSAGTASLRHDADRDLTVRFARVRCRSVKTTIEDGENGISRYYREGGKYIHDFA